MSKADRIRDSFRMPPMHNDGRRRTEFQETFDDDYVQNSMKNILRSQIKAEQRGDAQTELGASQYAKERLGNRIVNVPQALAVYQNVFISIDSRYRDRTFRLNEKGIFFNLGINVPSTIDGLIGLQFPLVNVTEIEVMDSIVFPKKYQSGIVYKPTNYFNEMTLLINEIFSQSYNGPRNRFHFTFLIQPYDTVRYLLPIAYNSVFKLSLPVLLDKTLNFKFYTPTADAGLDDDSFYVLINYTNPAKLTIVQPIDQVTGQPISHNFSSNDAICFEDFRSSSFTYDSTNPASIVYYEKFYPVTVINSTTFTIPLNFTVSELANDPQRPGSINYTNLKDLILNIISDYNYSLYFSGSKFAEIGDTLYFQGVRLSIPDDTVVFNDFAVTYLTRLEGLTILNILPYADGFTYTIDMNSSIYPLVDGGIPDGTDLIFSGTTLPPNAKPPVRIFDGARRIRFPLRFLCKM